MFFNFAFPCSPHCPSLEAGSVGGVSLDQDHYHSPALEGLAPIQVCGEAEAAAAAAAAQENLGGGNETRASMLLGSPVQLAPRSTVTRPV